MLWYPAHVLLLAVALALVLPEPGRWNPFALAPSAARALARDLPRAGRWAVGAGVLVIALIAVPAALITWGLTSGLPVGLRLVAPDASPIVALVCAAILLRLTFWLPPVWVWPSRRQRPGGSPPQATAAAPPREEGTQPSLLRQGYAARGAAPSTGSGQVVPHEAAMPDELLTRWGAELAAPLLLFALLGVYAPIIYRTVLEVARGLCERGENEQIAAPAMWLTYLPAAPAQRVVTLFTLLAARMSGPGPTSGASARMCVVAAGATIALAALIAIW